VCEVRLRRKRPNKVCLDGDEEVGLTVEVLLCARQVETEEKRAAQKRAAELDVRCGSLARAKARSDLEHKEAMEVWPIRFCRDPPLWQMVSLPSAGFGPI
jgi:hypothetical protein